MLHPPYFGRISSWVPSRVLPNCLCAASLLWIIFFLPIGDNYSVDSFVKMLSKPTVKKREREEEERNPIKMEISPLLPVLGLFISFIFSRSHTGLVQ